MTLSEEKSVEELDEIRNTLEREGLDPGCTDHQKIAHLWHLYIKSEASLKAALGTIMELQQQQSEEMREFENYVEHVRNLSSEREALTVEFAGENDQLKAENDQLRQEIETCKSDETRDMLIQQGLDEIAHCTTSEQIAYLLVERARLMDELEAEEQSHLVETVDGLMLAEKLHKQLDQVEKLETESSAHHSSSTESSADKNNEDLMRKLEQLEVSKEDLLSWKRQVRETDDDHLALRNEIERLEAEVQRGKTRTREQLDENEETMRKLRDDKNKQMQYIEELEAQCHKLRTEKKSNDLKMDYKEKELEDLRERERDLINKQRALLAADGNSQLKIQLGLIQENKLTLEQELLSLRDSLAKEKQNSSDLEKQLQSLQSEFEEAQTDFEEEERTLNGKLFAMQGELSEARLRIQFKECESKDTIKTQEKLHKKEDELMQLRNQLQEEKFSRSLSTMGSDDSNKQLAAMRQREKEFQKKKQ